MNSLARHAICLSQFYQRKDVVLGKSPNRIKCRTGTPHLSYPDGSTGAGGETGRAALWILGSFALLFAAIFIYSGQIAPSRNSVVLLYVFAGLWTIDRVKAIAIANNPTIAAAVNAL
jgi:hypothetical protein